MNKKGFTLIELVLTLSILSIILSVAAISYKRCVEASKKRCIIAEGQEIFEAIQWSFEKDASNITVPRLESEVENMIDYDIVVKDIKNKIVSLEFKFDNKNYSMVADLIYIKNKITDKEFGEVLYDQ